MTTDQKKGEQIGAMVDARKFKALYKRAKRIERKEEGFKRK